MLKSLLVGLACGVVLSVLTSTVTIASSGSGVIAEELAAAPASNPGLSGSNPVRRPRASAHAGISHWQRQLSYWQTLPLAEQLVAVNGYFNGLAFAQDQTQWQQPDYWATPWETLIAAAGDCEDFAIAKYFSLRQLGVPASRLRLAYVYAQAQQEAHMVLIYGLGTGAEQVLDTLQEPMLRLNERLDLRPVYSFNSQGLWQFMSLREERRAGSADALPQWRDMLLRSGASAAYW